MQSALKYDQAIFDLLDIEAVLSTAQLATLEKREQVVGVQFRASVREWFGIADAERLFFDNTNSDHLTKLAELGVPAETA